MTTSTALNDLVTLMVEKKGYAYTTGYLQSFLMQAIASNTKKNQAMILSDIQYHLKNLQSA